LCRRFTGKVQLEIISKAAIRPFADKRDEATSTKEKNTHYCCIYQIKATPQFKVINTTYIYRMGFIQTYSRILWGNDNT